MTDHDHPLDERASAHLDGDRTDGAPDRELDERIQRLAAARGALRAAPVPPIDAARREQAIAAALTAFDHAGAEPSGVPTPLRPRRRLRGLQMAGIAAAIVALALAVPLLSRLDPGSDSAVVMPPAESPTDAAAEAGAVAPDASALRSAQGPEDLGNFADLDALADAARARTSGTSTSGEVPTAVAGPGGRDGGCPEQRTAGTTTVLVALATVDGQPVTVVVEEDAAGTRTLVVLRRDDCSTIARQRL